MRKSLDSRVRRLEGNTQDPIAAQWESMTAAYRTAEERFRTGAPWPDLTPGIITKIEELEAKAAAPGCRPADANRLRSEAQALGRVLEGEKARRPELEAMGIVFGRS